MSYICEVCGPRLDCHSILCRNCDIGIIYEVNYGKERPSGTAHPGEAFRKPLAQQVLPLIDMEESEMLVWSA